MKSKSFACAAAAAFLALGLVVARYGARQERAAETERAALEEKRANLQAGIKQAQDRIIADNRARIQLQAAAKAGPAASSPASGAGDTPIGLITAHPKLMAAFLKFFRANLRQRFGVYYQMAGLSADQIAKFEDLATGHQEDQMDLAATAANQGLPETDPAIDALRKQQNDTFRADEVALLGEGGYQQLRQFNREQGAQAVATAVGQLALDSEPLSNAQAGQIMQIVSNASPSFQKGGSVDLQSIDWDAVTTQAGSVLSGSQLEALTAQVDALRLTVMTQKYFAKKQ
jgi:hypothetical protein